MLLVTQTQHDSGAIPSTRPLFSNRICDCSPSSRRGHPGMLPLRLQPQSHNVERPRSGRDPSPARNTGRNGRDQRASWRRVRHIWSTSAMCFWDSPGSRVRASILRFAPGDRDEHTPGGICNAFFQMMVLLNVCDIQILEHNRTEPIHQLSGSGEQNRAVCWRSVHGRVRRSSGLSSVQECLSLLLKAFSAPLQEPSHRCGRTGGSRSSPRLRGWQRTPKRGRFR